MTDARTYWLDHFTAADPATLEVFVALTPEDCQPLLEHLKIPRVPGKSFESAENRVFGFGADTIKLFHPGRWSLDALRDEVTFLNDLLDAGVSVVRPVGTPGTFRGIHYQRYETVPEPYGLDPEVLDPPSLRSYVHLVARLHRVGAQRQALHRPKLEPAGTCQGLFDVIVRAGYLPAEHRGRYAELVSQLTERLQAVLAGVPMQRIHNDPGSWNVLWRPEGPLLMDLDDFDVGPVSVDLSVMHMPWRLSTISASASWAVKKPLQRAKVLAYYREICPFPEAWEQQLDPMGALRSLMFDAWFSARWSEPGFAAHYKEDDITDPGWWVGTMDQIEKRLS